MLIVLDTNIFVSALLSHGGYPEQLLELWQDKFYRLVTSDFQRDELARVLGYDKIKPFVTDQQIARLHQSLDDLAIVVEPKPGIAFSPDEDDNVIIGTAIVGNADILVSGDRKHLLPLGSVEGIPILSPRQAVERITAASGQDDE